MNISVKTAHFQETTGVGRCGPAALKVVLDYFDTPMTEDELADLCGTHPDHGTTGPQILEAAKLLGFKAKMKDEATYADIEKCLRRKVPPIVVWYTPGDEKAVRDGFMPDGHYSPVCGLTKTHIILEDTEIGRHRKISRKEFIRAWFDYDTEVPQKDGFFVRRLIVIEKK